MHKVLSPIFLLLALLASPAWAQTVYTLAVVPQFNPVDIGLRWTPLLQRIEQETGLSLQIPRLERYVLIKQQ